MVDIYLGPERRHFRIHKSIICKKIPYFDKMFNSGFKEGSDNKDELPEDQADSFEILQEWVYTGVLRPLKLVQGSIANVNYLALPFLTLANKLCLPKLMDILVTQYLDLMAKGNILPNARSINEMFRGLPERLAFRKYFILSLHYILNGQSRTKGHMKIWPTEALSKLVAEDPNLSLAYFEVIRNHPIGMPAVDPRTLPRCTFHQHGPEEECPATTNA